MGVLRTCRLYSSCTLYSVLRNTVDMHTACCFLGCVMQVHMLSTYSVLDCGAVWYGSIRTVWSKAHPSPALSTTKLAVDQPGPKYVVVQVCELKYEKAKNFGALKILYLRIKKFYSIYNKICKLCMHVDTCMHAHGGCQKTPSYVRKIRFYERHAVLR